MAKQENVKSIETVKPAPLAIPEDIKAHAGQGVEGLGKDDVRPPRLALAQAMSPQVKRDDIKSIDGLREGNLFNDLSGEIYGDGPIDIVVVRCLGARGVEFAPLEEGGGIIDIDVKLTDPRMQFTTDPGNPKNRIQPIATKFYDFLVWMPEQQEVLSLSMKGTQLKVAVNLNSLIKLPLKIDGQVVLSPPAWARTFALGTAMQKKDAYSWANFTVKQKGVTPADTREIAAALYESFAGKNIVIEREPGIDDEKFPATDM